MSDTKPLPDDPDRTVATPATPDPAPAPPAAASTAPPAASPAASSTAEPAAEPAATPAANPAADAPAATAAEPAPAGPVWAAPAGPGRLRTAGGQLRQSRVRVPLLVGAATLVLGCCLGAGIVAAGVAVFGDHHRGDDRGRITRDDRGPRGPVVRGDERGDDRKRIRPGDGFRKQPSPTPPATPPVTPPAPSPSPSAS
ncbi:hypothetical protein OHA72_25340 [Dactylosporangium sp. NBC_01737]|uniref:hypothetical protein n=1 Tax=Dactylosporangium sp. NBC_01737 TaxID=2975959 RepID=UPI002E0FA56A|nr:hypothetical protein OHA72_25340 [Dactylosporangium sp. NBC_01737]